MSSDRAVFYKEALGLLLTARLLCRGLMVPGGEPPAACDGHVSPSIMLLWGRRWRLS